MNVLLLERRNHCQKNRSGKRDDEGQREKQASKIVDSELKMANEELVKIHVHICRNCCQTRMQNMKRNSTLWENHFARKEFKLEEEILYKRKGMLLDKEKPGVSRHRVVIYGEKSRCLAR
ncbi:hypothetical protein P5673_030932 [Acropora cervicornis]|uniref:Uncharacterized protein n=1 Tax=Acropora cervicornis TaxID=6130 RepID=A0AAD9PTG3_ACRCE|nr:hypothetical protein P5673_030932 [Acropora cervicornis]